MAADPYAEFVQTELPLRPFAPVDGPAGYVPIRSGPGPRQLAWIDPAAFGGGGGARTEPISVYNGGSPELLFTEDGDVLVTQVPYDAP